MEAQTNNTSQHEKYNTRSIRLNLSQKSNLTFTQRRVKMNEKEVGAELAKIKHVTFGDAAMER